MRLGRRPLFFLILAAINLVLIPPTPSEFRWVNVSMACLATFWAVLLSIEEIANRRQDRGRAEASGGR